MKTQIFKSYAEFLERTDKEINGVSEDFSKEHPNFERENKTNKGCWNCYSCNNCTRCVRCDRCDRCRNCDNCYNCDSCDSCASCTRCVRCDRCHNCYNCDNCDSCTSCTRCVRCVSCDNCTSCDSKKGTFIIPAIDNIHQKVLDAINSNGNKLDMSDWHTCETTHCRAGWVEVLAGKEGRELAKKTNTAFAAMQIYYKSSPIKVSPVRFYESNELAMADIIRCAEEEKKLKP